MADLGTLATPDERQRLADLLLDVARRAGQVILEIYRTDFEVREKADRSPVSDADERAEALILAALEAACPAIPVVAEERVAAGGLPADDVGERFFLVDPLDGTREFISRNGEFTVNIALVEGGRPTAGVVHVPALDQSYWVDGLGRAWRHHAGQGDQPIQCRAYPADGLIVLASRNHRDADTDAFLARLPVARLTSAGSSLKFCRVAEAAADLYPRFGTTMEWDTAAGHAVLAAAGGHVVQPDGAPFLYKKPGFRNGAFVALGAFDPGRIVTG